MATVFEPHTLAIGSTSATGVQGFSYAPVGGGQPLVSLSDDAGVAIFTPHGAIGGSITFDDPSQADAFANQSGSLSVNGKDSAGGADKTYTFAGAQTGEAGMNLTTGGAAGCTVQFAATAVALT
ncbi:MAG: hypothetical protein KAV00_06815 [Phycisphaerae bacterium]|nr:hypothetical protein [Phycisphaerae bacterium]